MGEFDNINVDAKTAAAIMGSPFAIGVKRFLEKYAPPQVVATPTRADVGTPAEKPKMDLKEWRDTQKITPPDAINTEYIKNEMNSKA